MGRYDPGVSHGIPPDAVTVAARRRREPAEERLREAENRALFEIDGERTTSVPFVD
jgi:hypothetical protein